MNFWALLYLTAPALLFLTTFVKPVLGIPLAVSFLTLLVVLARNALKQDRLHRTDSNTPRLAGMAITALLSAGVVALMGFATGHYCWDWIKHWALLNSLETLPWPVELTLQGTPGYLRFYVGAYLVPAGLAHLTGLGIVPCTAAWYGLGLAIAFTLLSNPTSGATVSRVRLLWIVPLLLCMAGADAWLQTLLRPDGQPITVTGFHHEWWANALLDHPLQYGSPLCLLLWVPHQAIPAFIAIGLARRLKSASDLAPTALATATLALWSPYALIGSALLLVPHVLSQTTLRQTLCRPGWITGGAMLAGCAFVALIAWGLSHELPTGGLCLSCLRERLAHPGPYVLFLAVELAIPLLLLRRRLFDDAASIAAIATLAVLPWLGGPVPDAVMRISMPALIYLFARCAHDIVQRPPHQFAAAAALILALSGPTVWGEASFHLEGGTRPRALLPRDPLASPYYTVWASRTTYSAQEFFEICGWKWKPQYFASTPPPSWPSAASAPTR